MNYIVLEGISLYLFLIMTMLLLLISAGCLICVVLLDKRGFFLNILLSRKNDEIKNLVKENFVLRLKSGELDIDEK